MHYIHLQIPVPECDKNGIQVASSPQMENTLFHKPTFLFTFHQSCLQHSALQVRDSLDEPSVKRRERSELGHLNSLSEIKQCNSSIRQQISKIKDFMIPRRGTDLPGICAAVPVSLLVSAQSHTQCSLYCLEECHQDF